MIRRDFIGTLIASGLAVTTNHWQSSGERELLRKRLVRLTRLPKHKLRDCKIVFITEFKKEFVLPVKDVITTTNSYCWEFSPFYSRITDRIGSYILLDDEFYKVASGRFVSNNNFDPGDTVNIRHTFNFDPRMRNPSTSDLFMNFNDKPVIGYTYKYKEIK